MTPALLREQYAQFLYVFHSIGGALRFTRKHRLWEGFLGYGWVSRLAMILAVLAGLQFLSVLTKYLKRIDVTDPISTMGVMGNFLQDVIKAEYNFLFAGGMKYLMLIFLEVLIFHITRRSLAIFKLKTGEPTLKAFINAQVRMIQISIVCFFMESILSGVAKGALQVTPIPDFLIPALIFPIQCFFTGVPVVDNFYEQYNYSIKQSLKTIRPYAGVAIALGLILNILFLIPVLGSILGPFLAAITSVLVMYELSELGKRKDQGALLEEELV